MDPDSSPQAYPHAAALTCKGCAAIRNSNCLKPTEGTTPSPTTTTTSAAACAYPTNSSQVSLVVFDGEPRGGDLGEIGSCGCDVGKKAFYVGGPTSDTYTGKYSTFVEYPLQKDGPLICADFCVIDEAGDECKFSNTSAQMTIYFQPYCTRGICHTYVYMGKSDDETGSNGLICGSRNFTQRDGWNDDGSLIQMDPDTSPQVRLTHGSRYFNRVFSAFVHAAAFTCKGCAAIRNSNCLKHVTGTASTGPPATAAPGTCTYKWGDWIDSSACPDSCGACGTITQTRTCATRSCPCVGSTTQTVTCNKAPCAFPRQSCCEPYEALNINGTILCATDDDKNPTPGPPSGGASTRQPGGMPGVPGVATPPPGGVPPATAGAPSAPRVATPTPAESAAIADAAASPKKRKLKKPSLPHRK